MGINSINAIILGSVRIVAAGTIVVGSNSGMIASVLHNGAGDDTWTVDTESQVGPEDSIEVRVEGTVPGLWSVERLTSLTFRVRIVDDADVALATAYSLLVYRRLEG